MEKKASAPTTGARLTRKATPQPPKGRHNLAQDVKSVTKLKIDRQLDLSERPFTADHFALRPFDVPVLEDANAVQLALMQVMQMLVMRRIEHKTAGLLLYALQTASTNLRNTRFEPVLATDVVIDRDTVRLTAIDGPQWFEEDFAEDQESEDESGNRTLRRWPRNVRPPWQDCSGIRTANRVVARRQEISVVDVQLAKKTGFDGSGPS